MKKISIIISIIILTLFGFYLIGDSVEGIQVLSGTLLQNYQGGTGKDTSGWGTSTDIQCLQITDGVWGTTTCGGTGGGDSYWYASGTEIWATNTANDIILSGKNINFDNTGYIGFYEVFNGVNFGSLYGEAADTLTYEVSGRKGILDFTKLTTDNSYFFPDASGTLALTRDYFNTTSISTNYVPTSTIANYLTSALISTNYISTTTGAGYFTIVGANASNTAWLADNDTFAASSSEYLTKLLIANNYYSTTAIDASNSAWEGIGAETDPEWSASNTEYLTIPLIVANYVSTTTIANYLTTALIGTNYIATGSASSVQWAAATAIVNASSSGWSAAQATVNASSTSWSSAKAILDASSSIWSLGYNHAASANATLTASSSIWSLGYNWANSANATLTASSSNWQSTFITVTASSADWSLARARFGTLTNLKWCSSDGSKINCIENAPAGGGVTSLNALTGDLTIFDTADITWSASGTVGVKGAIPSNATTGTALSAMAGAVTDAQVPDNITITETDPEWSASNTEYLTIPLLSTNYVSTTTGLTYLTKTLAAANYAPTTSPTLTGTTTISDAKINGNLYASGSSQFMAIIGSSLNISASTTLKDLGLGTGNLLTTGKLSGASLAITASSSLADLILTGNFYASGTAAHFQNLKSQTTILTGSTTLSTTFGNCNKLTTATGVISCGTDDDVPEVGDLDAFVGGTYTTYDTTANQLDLDPEIATSTISVNFAITSVSEDLRYAYVYTAYAKNLTEVGCMTNAGTSSIELGETSQTSYTTTSEMLNTLVCDNNMATTSSFGDAILGARSQLMIKITGKTGATSTRVWITSYPTD